MSRNERNERDLHPSPIVTFYGPNHDKAVGNDMGSMADHQGFNSGRYTQEMTERAYGRDRDR